jgi:peptide-methionine (S)-S-oxide reductase
MKLRASFWLVAACLLGMIKFSFGEMTENTKAGTTETAVFGGGCFWCLDAQFKLLDGVKTVTSGYAGGRTKNPSYEQVCTDTTGHAEVIKVDFDPTRITYADLLRKFFLAHDPTTLNRQGPDTGTQYRSIILYENDQQKAVAEQVKAEAQKTWPDPIVTQMVPLKDFYAAEDYHQDYFAKNPQAGYCRLVVAPKVRKFEKELEKEKAQVGR